MNKWAKKNWKPKITFADPPWDIEQKHDEMVAKLLKGRWPLIPLQTALGVTPTDEEKKASGKYGHVMGITYLIRMARNNGWPIRVAVIDGQTWVYLPQSVIDSEV
jgi:hypothetical protein